MPLNTKRQAHWNRAGIETAREYVKDRKFGRALPLLFSLLRSNPEDPEALDQTATCYFHLGDHETAAKLLGRVLESRPQVPRLWGKLAAVQASGGNKAAAAAAYRRALALAPKDVGLLAAYNHLEPFAAGSSYALRLAEVLHNTASEKRERTLAHFALAKIADRAGDTDTAFRHYSSANELKSAEYSCELQEKFVRTQEACFFAHSHDGEEGGGPRILFVTGLPRTGTTLLETCLTRHPGVTSIGESGALSKTAAQARALVPQHAGRGAWNWLEQLRPEDISRLRRYFLQSTLGAAESETQVIIDKMPLNCFEAGLAHVLLPNAKFLFMSRHPMDTGLSNFTTNFGRGNGFSRRLDWIGHLTRWAYRSAMDYQSKLGAQYRVQSYEALVTDPEGQLRAVLQHAGLDWDPVCMTPEQTQNTVRTASLMQVREKINTGALGKWRRYETQLEPLMDALGGRAWLAQWQQWDQQAAETGRFLAVPV